MALAACAVYLFASDAQSSDYALIDLGKVNADDADLIAHGINDHGEIVGKLQLFSESGTRAFVWLPEANYGKSAGMYLLDPLVSLGDPGALGTVAYDINNAGIAVGRDRENQSTASPLIWNLGNMSNLYLGADNARAASINNDSPPIIVGGIGPDYEDAGSSITAGGGGAFHYEYDPMDSQVTALTLPGQRDGVAHGVSDTTSGNLRIAGNMSCDPAQPEKCFAPPQTCVEDTRDGVWWSAPTSPAELEAPAMVSDFTTYVNGHAVSDDRYIAGFGRDPNAGPPDCRWRAYFWSNPTATPDELPVFDDTVLDTELGLDIRDQVGDLIEVVGRNVDDLRALLWRGSENQDSYDWGSIALDLNDSNLIGSLGSFTRLISANAINDDGWIAGFGAKGSETRAYVLIPCDDYASQSLCPTDITGRDSSCGDGVIDVFDLLLLLANWGTNGAGAGLSDGPNGTGGNVVNVFDLLELLAAWGPCTFSAHVDVMSLEDEVIDAGLTMDDWDDFEYTMQNGTQAEKDQYKCWMERYLSGCSPCAPCQYADPYSPRQ